MKTKNGKAEKQETTAAEITGRERYSEVQQVPLSPTQKRQLLQCAGTVKGMKAGSLARHFIALGLARWQASGRIETAA